jgi:hypothetical protein
VNGAPTCSRLGCDELAVAVFAFDARECLVWLDPIGPGGRGAGVLCTTHADRMSPPFGWNLLDRRGAESRLWLGRTKAVTEVAPSRRRERAPRTRTCAPAGPRLPFESTVPASVPVPVPTAVPAPAIAREPEPVARIAERTPEPVAAPTGAPWSPHDRPGPEFGGVLDARTPLLARAFEGSRPVEDPK